MIKMCLKVHVTRDTIMDDLINVSLFESSEKRKRVKMNKVIWDMTLKYHHKLEIPNLWQSHVRD